MSIVCGLHDPQECETWIGADTRCTSGRFIYPTAAQKIASAGSWRIGGTGNARAMALIRRHADQLAEMTSAMQLSDAFRNLLREDGWAAESNPGGPPLYLARFLVASAKGIWAIDTDFSVESCGSHFAAIGSGEEYAYGAAHALMARYHRPEAVIKAALEAAIAFNNACGGATQIERVIA